MCSAELFERCMNEGDGGEVRGVAAAKGAPGMDAVTGTSISSSRSTTGV